MEGRSNSGENFAHGLRFDQVWSFGEQEGGQRGNTQSVEALIKGDNEATSDKAGMGYSIYCPTRSSGC